jgi:ketosteroid isomerase-like protein
MGHPHEKVLRDAYAAFAKGDVPGFFALCTSNITFEVPGHGLLSGRHTKDEFLSKLGPAMQAVAGTFHEEIVHAVAGDEHGAVLVAQRAQRDGKPHGWHCTHWWTFKGDKLASFREYVDDAAAFDAAWHK